MPQNIQELERGTGTQTDATAEALIHNLTKSWQDHAEATSINGAMVRTSTFNLIVFSADRAAAEDAEKVLPSLVDLHPCRAVHIIADPQPSVPLSACSLLHTKVEGGVRVIACEQVTLQAGTHALQSLQGVVAPLLSPELPVYLWWRGNPPFEGHLFEQLVQAADRVIYDSAWFLEAEEDLPWAVDLIAKYTPFEVAFTDVNFARLTPWRNLVAQFFDGAHQVRALDGVDQLIIEFADGNVTPDRVPVQTWLTVGWFATRLNWTSRGNVNAPVKDETRFTLARDGASIEVVLRRVQSELPGLRAVELHSTLPTPAAYRVELMPGEKLARTVKSVDGQAPLERVVEMERASYADLIACELDMPGRDRVYEEALKFAAGLPAGVDDVSPS